MRFVFVFSFLALSVLAISQDGSTAIDLYKGKKIQAENGLKGLKSGKEWRVPPKYFKFEAYAYNYLLCYKPDGNVDVYSNSSVNELKIEDLSLAQLHIYLQFANSDIKPTIKNDHWGFTTGIVTVQEKFDSLFVICRENSSDHKETLDCDDVVGFSLNGKLGVVSNINEELVPPGDYTGFRSEFLANAIEGHQFILTCYRKDGAMEFFDPVYKMKLPGFEKKYNEGKGMAVQFQKFWNGLKVFKGPNGNMGLITDEGKIFLPAAAEKIQFQGFTFTCNGTTLKCTDYYGATVVSKADTILLSSVKKPIFMADFTSIDYLAKGLDAEGFKQSVRWDYDYKQPSVEYRHCRYCDGGIVHYSSTTVVGTKVVKEGYTYTIRYDRMVGGLTGLNFKVTEKYTVPPEVEKILKTEEKSAVCSFCKGYVDYQKIYRWDEESKAFVGYYHYGE